MKRTGDFSGLASISAPLLVSAPARSQRRSSRANGGKSGLRHAVRSSLERNSKNIIAAADEMPADKYSYQSTPAQMTFGHMVDAHRRRRIILALLEDFRRACARLRTKLADTDPKDKLVRGAEGLVRLLHAGAGQGGRFEPGRQC